MQLTFLQLFSLLLPDDILVDDLLNHILEVDVKRCHVRVPAVLILENNLLDEAVYQRPVVYAASFTWWELAPMIQRKGMPLEECA